MFERELTLLLQQVDRERPHVRRRRGTFKRSKLRARDGGERISMPLGKGRARRAARHWLRGRGRGQAFALIGSRSWWVGPRAEGWSGLGLGVFVGGFWRGYLHVGLRVAATGKGRGPWKFWEGRGAGRRRPRGIRGSGTLLRMLGSGRAVRFPYREPGAPEGSKLAPATSPSCQARSPRCLRAGPGPLQVGTSALLHHELALLPSQTQTSNTESLCRPRPAWTGGETCSRSELGTRPPFPGFGPSSVRSLPLPLPHLLPFCQTFSSAPVSLRYQSRLVPSRSPSSIYFTTL